MDEAEYLKKCKAIEEVSRMVADTDYGNLQVWKSGNIFYILDFNRNEIISGAENDIMQKYIYLQTSAKHNRGEI